MATKNQSPRKLKNFQGLWSFSEWFSVLFQVGVHGFFQHSAYGIAILGNHLTVEPDEAASVPCGVFAIQDDDELALDHYEGYPVFYQKQTLHVPEVMAVGTKEVVLRDIDAMIYTMPTDHRLGLPSTYYWKVCKQGYRDFHFALRYLEKALFDSRAEME